MKLWQLSKIVQMFNAEKAPNKTLKTIIALSPR